MKLKKNKIYIFVSLFILVIVFAFILFFLNREKHRNNDINENILNINDTNTQDKNIISREENKNNILNNQLDVVEEKDEWGESTPITEENLRLKQVTDAFSYFLTKQCISKFYSSKDTAYNLLPNELKKYNIENFYGNIQEASFCIDSIYKASVRISKNIYVVYYRLETENNSCVNKCCAVKIDNKNLSFNIYPFEYLELIGMSKLSENDLISLDIIKIDDIEKTEFTKYEISEIKTSKIACVKEIYERCQFDYNFNKEHLYNSLDEEYRKTKFENINNFNKYLNNSKVLKGNVNSYQENNMEECTQYIVLGSYDNYYIFNTINVMNYSIILDSYSIVTKPYLELYNSSYPTVQTKYCLDRVRRAINDKNYRFIYNKLDESFKEKKYSNYSDFENFIKQTFYEENSFEYLRFNKITNESYRYTIKITDSTGGSFSYRNLNMTIILKNDADFLISIEQ